MHPTALEQLSFFGPFNKNKVPTVPTVCQQPSTLFFQEIHYFNSETHTRPPYDISSKGCSQQHQKQGVQKVALQECPPVPHMPEKDLVQDTVSAFKSDQSLKSTIGEDAELCIPIWHTGTCKAFLMHVSTALNAIEKRGTFKAHKEAVEAYVEQRKVVKQAKAALAFPTTPASKGKKTSKKSSKKASEKALQKTKEGMALADAPATELHVEYQADYKKAKLAAEAPRTSAKPLLPRCFSSTQLCSLQMPSMRGTR
jgi:hypothetical protein